MMERVIDRFTDEEFFLSNFYVSPITFNGKIYKTVEHAYQASKADNESEHEWIRWMDTPGKAKRNGSDPHKVHLRKDWEEIKLDLMLELVRIKFTDPVLRKLLIDTKNYLLVESNYWHDNFSGNCTCSDCKNIEGQNHLGKILMKVRQEIIDSQ